MPMMHHSNIDQPTNWGRHRCLRAGALRPRHRPRPACSNCLYCFKPGITTASNFMLAGCHLQGCASGLGVVGTLGLRGTGRGRGGISGR